MIFGRRRRAQRAAGEHDSIQTHYGSSQLPGEGLEPEYEEIIRAQLARLGVPLDTVAVEASAAGATPEGRNIYVGMVRLTKWEPATSLRLLMALPLLELKTRQSLETSWLTDVSQFGGLWAHASSALRTSEVLGEIRDAIMQLDPAAAVSDSNPPSDGGWSPSIVPATGRRTLR